ncbi:MAG TPA: hypothetical protein VFC42_17015 [Methylomirabilota bacterium]|jgi:hypothetical protein|nr:hypothetical protein [Methylomirabilota bacterium]
MDSITLTPPKDAHAPTIDRDARLRAIRASLPGQVLCERVAQARLTYGSLYTLAEIRERVRTSLPRQLGRVRDTQLETIENYAQRIPDEVLLKYDEAQRSGLFSRFMVARPTYGHQPDVDPWIVGQITGTELHAVIARWED